MKKEILESPSLEVEPEVGLIGLSSRLDEAMNAGDIEAFQETLARYPGQKNLLTVHGDTLLSKAAWQGKTAFVRCMLDAGWPPLHRQWGEPPCPSALEWVCGRSKNTTLAHLLLDHLSSKDLDEGHRENLGYILKMAVLESEADVLKKLVALNPVLDDGAQARLLSDAKSIEFFEILEPVCSEKNRKTVLAWAIQEKQPESFLRHLIGKGYSLDEALESACAIRSPSALALLLEVSPQIAVVASENPRPVFWRLFDELDEKEIHQAREVVDMLLNNGFNPGLAKKDDWLDDIFGEQTRHLLKKETLVDFFSMADMLLSRAGKTLGDKENLLEWMCRFATNEGVLPYLERALRAGLDPNRKGHEGNTCLHVLARHKDCPESVAIAMSNVLFAFGTKSGIKNNPGWENPAGRYPIGYAAESGRFGLATHLCRKGVEGGWFGLLWWVIDLDRLDVLQSLALEDFGAEIFGNNEEVPGGEMSPMQMAAESRKSLMVPFLAEVGCDPDKTTGDFSQTPLELALTRMNWVRRGTEQKVDVPLVKALLEAGANPTLPAASGESLPDFIRKEWKMVWEHSAPTREAFDIIESAQAQWVLDHALPPSMESIPVAARRI
jgi:ankyrin repeat protein